MSKKASKSKPVFSFPTILDEELSLVEKDGFGHRHFSQALQHIIEDTKVGASFSVGLLGGWGTGKSTIKSMYLSGLDASKPRSKKLSAITFNAWRHGGEEDLKRALLRESYLALGGQEADIDKKLFNQVNDEEKTSGDWGTFFKELSIQVVGILCLFAMFFLIVLAGISAIASTAAKDNPFSFSAMLVAAAVITIFTIRYLVRFRIQMPTFMQPRTTISFPSRSAEEYEKHLLSQIRKHYERNSSLERIIVFVDDLDRLSATEMVRGLDAIRSFLELPLNKISKHLSVVFVISCDEDKVAEALRSKRRPSEDLPATVITKTDARRYLDRLFQFRLEIPPFPKLDMREFARSKILESSAFVHSLEERGGKLDDVIDQLIHVGVQSPRNAIQLVNGYLQSWWLAVEREREGRGSSKPGALFNGAVTNHPKFLAALTVLRVDFPDFYDCIQSRPSFLDEFGAVILDKQSATELPNQSKEFLEKYARIDPENHTATLKAEYASLRQYLASIQNLERPASLQPLLLFSVDSLSRQYGDSAANVFNSLVSNDVDGILEALGEQFSSGKLGASQTKLLTDLFEQARRDNVSDRTLQACRALCKLSPRFPDDEGRAIVAALARELAETKTLREFLGAEEAGRLASALGITERQRVSHAFINDLLSGGEIAWQKPNKGECTFEEIRQAVDDVLRLALTTWRECGLENSAQKKVCDFLKTHEIKYKKKTHELRFKFFREYFYEFEPELSPYLLESFATQATAEIAADRFKPNVLKSDSLVRIRFWFDRLHEGGTSEKSLLWEKLTLLISAKNQFAAQFAWQFASESKDTATDTDAKVFLDAWIERMRRDFSEEEWNMDDWTEGAQYLVLFTQHFSGLVNEETGESLRTIAVGWTDPEYADEDSIKSAIQLLDILRHNQTSVWNNAITDLLDGDYVKRSSALVYSYLSFYQQAEESVKDTISQRITKTLSSGSLDQNQMTFVQTICDQLPPDAWVESRWQNVAQHAFSRLQQMHADEAYIRSVLPAFCCHLADAPDNTFANHFLPMMQNSMGTQAAFTAIVQIMNSHWKQTVDELQQFNAHQVATFLRDFINQNKSHAGVTDSFVALLEIWEANERDDSISQLIQPLLKNIWNRHPQTMINHSAEVNELAANDDLVAMICSPKDQLAEEDFSAFTSSLVSSLDHDKIVQLSEGIIETEPVEYQGHTDYSLNLWTKALRDQVNNTMSQILEERQLSEEQYLRIITVVPSEAIASLNAEKITDLASAKHGAQPQHKLLARLSEISKTQNEKFGGHLSNGLIAALPNLVANEFETVSKALFELDAYDALRRDTETLGALDSDQKDILFKIFPKLK